MSTEDNIKNQLLRNTLFYNGMERATHFNDNFMDYVIAVSVFMNIKVDNDKIMVQIYDRQTGEEMDLRKYPAKTFQDLKNAVDNIQDLYNKQFP